MEIFGDAVRPGSADVGIGLHKFRDPGLTEEWSTVPLEIDVTEFHTYAVDWRPGSLVFTVDGMPVRRIGQSPELSGPAGCWRSSTSRTRPPARASRRCPS